MTEHFIAKVTANLGVARDFRTLHVMRLQNGLSELIVSAEIGVGDLISLRSLN